MQQQEREITFADIFFKLLRGWPYWLTGIILGSAIAFVINKITPNIYQAKATIIIEDKKTASGLEAVITTLGYNNPQSGFENEMLILKSKTLIRRTLSKLDFEIEIYLEGKAKIIEQYHPLPFKVLYDSSHIQITEAPFDLQFEDAENFTLKLSKQGKLHIYNNLQVNEEIQPKFKAGKYKIDEWIEGEHYRFKIVNPNLQDNQKSFQLVFRNPDKLLSEYFSLIKVNPVGIEAKGVEIVVLGNNHAKAQAFLSNFIEEYNNLGKDYKNKVAQNTLSFIDEQLQGIEDTLRMVEYTLERFQASNKIIDLTTEGQMLFQQLSVLDQQLAEEISRNKYYVYLIDFLKQKRDPTNLTNPSAAGVSDPSLISSITVLNNLYAKKSEQESSFSKINPLTEQLQKQIETVTLSLISNIGNLIEASNIRLTDLRVRQKRFESQLSAFPMMEKNFLNIKRKYGLLENLYVLLLQKRTETGIALAATESDFRIVDAAEASRAPIKPQKTTNLFLGALIGFILPVIFLFTRHLFNTVVDNPNLIPQITGLSIIGIVGHNNRKETTVSFSYPKSVMAESFRAIRTNLKYFIPKPLPLGNILLVTSSVGGEGKTFTSINIAGVMAINNKKTILVGLDLRKPKIYGDFNISNEIGVTSVLVGNSTLQNAIRQSHVPNLDILTAGPIPPNPSELLATDTFFELIANLQKSYEYIVLDTPPIGIVSDGLDLMKLAHATLYVTRHNKTPKALLQNIFTNENLLAHAKSLAVVYNDFSFDSGSYSYGYGYGYSYGYGYLEEEQPDNVLTKFLKRFKKM